MGRTPRRELMSPKLRQVIQRAKEVPKVQFTSIAHLMTMDLYREAWKRLNKGSSPGIDGVSAKAYEEHLEENLQKLHERVKAGNYQAPPSRRVYIPKDSGGQRPIAIGCQEDKIVQGVVTILLEAIFERDFLPFSYGFRPGRDPHQALEALRVILTEGQMSCVLDADIKDFFGTLDHKWLMRFVAHRINDRTILRLIGKWLHAGVMEDGKIEYPEAGSPQGGIISPVLSNIYLHYVLDLWVHHRMRQQMRGKMYTVRYADDVIFCFQYGDDAERFLEALKDRLAKFNLKLHPDKTKIVELGRPTKNGSNPGGKPGAFDFLGFTHFWGRSRKGNPVVKRWTSGKRLRRFLIRIWEWCKIHRHDPVAAQARGLNSKLRGHYQYYGVTHNFQRIQYAAECVRRAWHYWLSRRSQRSGANWTWFNHMLRRFRFPKPCLPRSWLRARLQGELF